MSEPRQTADRHTPVLLDSCVELLAPAAQGEDAVIVERIQKLIELNNQYYSGVTLSLSIGAATSEPGERMETVVQRADANMYADKRRYYLAGEVADRRAG